MVLAGGTAMLRNMQPDDRLYNVAPMSHIIGLGGMLLAAIWAGATAELVAQFKPDHLAAAVQEDRVSYIMGVPTIFARVLDYAKAHQISLNSKRLRYLAVGGMPLDSILKQQIEDAFGIVVGNSYGMTEICPVTRPPGTTVGDSVGQVQPGMELRLVREDGQDVAVGETGEIWAKGPNLMLGYYRDEQATESVKRPDGFFNTGDLGRMDSHGNLSLVGRTKDLIIRSGFNVYPVEIESVLLKFPGVAFAAVVGRPVAGNEEIIAYVQPSPGRLIDLPEIEAWAHENLSPYKRPAEIILANELPIGPSGKIAKSKLKEQWSGKA
jgi:long-chain acyl-CoA synthetase